MEGSRGGGTEKNYKKPVIDPGGNLKQTKKPLHQKKNQQKVSKPLEKNFKARGVKRPEGSIKIRALEGKDYVLKRGGDVGTRYRGVGGGEHGKTKGAGMWTRIGKNTRKKGVFCGKKSKRGPIEKKNREPRWSGRLRERKHFLRGKTGLGDNLWGGEGEGSICRGGLNKKHGVGWFGVGPTNSKKFKAKTKRPRQRGGGT